MWWRSLWLVPMAGLRAGAGPSVFSTDETLLPLDRCRRFRADIVDHPVYPLDFVRNPVGDPGQNLRGKGVPVRGHAVPAGDGAQRDNLVVGSIVPLHSDGTDREQHRERLPDIVVKPGRSDFFGVDVVRPPEDLQVLRGHLADDPDGEARAGKRMSANHLFRQAQLSANLANLVLEQLPQRLQQSKRKSLRQSADVVMGLDCD